MHFFVDEMQNHLEPEEHLPQMALSDTFTDLGNETFRNLEKSKFLEFTNDAIEIKLLSRNPNFDHLTLLVT